MKELNLKLKKQNYSLYEGLTHTWIRILLYEYLILSFLDSKEIIVKNTFKYILGIKYLLNKETIKDSEKLFLKNDLEFWKIINYCEYLLCLKNSIDDTIIDSVNITHKIKSDEMIKNKRIFSGNLISVFDLLSSKNYIKIWTLFDKFSFINIIFYKKKIFNSNENNLIIDKIMLDVVEDSEKLLNLSDVEKVNFLDLDSLLLFYDYAKMIPRKPKIILNLEMLNNNDMMKSINYSITQNMFKEITNTNLLEMKKILTKK